MRAGPGLALSAAPAAAAAVGALGLSVSAAAASSPPPRWPPPPPGPDSRPTTKPTDSPVTSAQIQVLLDADTSFDMAGLYTRPPGACRKAEREVLLLGIVVPAAARSLGRARVEIQLVGVH